MNLKKLLITAVVIIVVLIAGALLWRGGFLWQGVGTAPVSTPPAEGIAPTSQPGVEGITPTSQPGVEGQTGGQTTGGDIGKMTDDIYVEVAVQTIYYAQKDPTGWATHGEKDLLAKYDVTQENLKAYADALQKDPSRAQAVAQKYAKRLQEMQQTGK